MLLAYSTDNPSFAFREATSSGENICLFMGLATCKTDFEYRSSVSVLASGYQVSSDLWSAFTTDDITNIYPDLEENPPNHVTNLPEAKINNPCMITVTNQYPD